MPDKPRLADQFRFGKRKPKPRALVTQDGTTIAQDGSVVAHDPAVLASCRGESFRIAGEPIAMAARPKPSGLLVTFDGAMPSRKA